MLGIWSVSARANPNCIGEMPKKIINIIIIITQNDNAK